MGSSIQKCGALGTITVRTKKPACLSAEGNVPIAQGSAQGVMEVSAVQVIEGRAPAIHCRFCERYSSEQRSCPPIVRVN
jgi:hypothetical protein